MALGVVHIKYKVSYIIKYNVAFQATCKRDHRLQRLKTVTRFLEEKKEEVLKQFDENTNWLHRVESEMRLLGQNGNIPEVRICMCVQI